MKEQSPSACAVPLFFASNAIYPVSLMPVWLQYISKCNPLSYGVDAMRSLLLIGDYSTLLVDILVLLLFTLFFIACASVVLKRLIE